MQLPLNIATPVNGALWALQTLGFAASLWGQVLIARRRVAGFTLWVIANAAMLVVSWCTGLYVMVALFAIQAALACGRFGSGARPKRWWWGRTRVSSFSETSHLARLPSRATRIGGAEAGRSACPGVSSCQRVDRPRFGVYRWCDAFLSGWQCTPPSAQAAWVAPRAGRG